MEGVLSDDRHHTHPIHIQSTLSAARVFGAPIRFLRGLLAIAVGWQERAQQRHRLRDLDRRLLDDMRIPPSAAEREAKKPFWRG